VVAGELRGFGKCMFVWEMRVNLAGEKSDNWEKFECMCAEYSKSEIKRREFVRVHKREIIKKVREKLI
jgi:uncharacterized protein YcgL (UPF0745 family)